MTHIGEDFTGTKIVVHLIADSAGELSVITGEGTDGSEVIGGGSTDRRLVPMPQPNGSRAASAACSPTPAADALAHSPARGSGGVPGGSRGVAEQQHPGQPVATPFKELGTSPRSPTMRSHPAI